MLRRLAVAAAITVAEPGTYHDVCTLHRRDVEDEVVVS